MAENPLQNENASMWMELHISRNKLKTTSKISALLAGFAMVALIELSIQEYKNDRGISSIYALTMYGVLTSVLIFLHIYSLMISTCILPDLDYIAAYEGNPKLGDFLIKTSPHRKFSTYVHVSWLFSNVLGNLCLLLDLLLILFIKFYPTSHEGLSNSGNSTLVSDDHVNNLDPHFVPLICSVIVLGILVVVYVVSSLHILKLKVTHHTGTFGSRINELQDDFSHLLHTLGGQNSTTYTIPEENLENKTPSPKQQSRVLLSLSSNSELLLNRESSSLPTTSFPQ